MISAVGLAIIVFICSNTKAEKAAGFKEEDMGTHEDCIHLM